MRPLTRDYLLEVDRMQVPEELKRKYLERRVHDIEQLIDALEKGDFAPAIRLGHQVKGNALTFDFPQMAGLGMEIENAARDKDKEALLRLLEAMNTEVHAAQRIYH
jgi:HPt (histidine-containing phosphotransfer) domain-containing protein